MGCLNSTTKVQPFENSTSRTNIHSQTAQQNGHIPNSQQNGHIPSSKIPDTPREVLGQLPNQSDTYSNHAGKDTRIIETRLSEETRLLPEETRLLLEETPLSEEIKEVSNVVQPISVRQKTVESGFNDQTESVKGTPSEHNISTRTDGQDSQRSTQREAVVVPTMPLSEEDLMQSHYTIKEIAKHNASKGHMDIFPFKACVYSTAKFKDAMKNVVKLKYEKLKEEKNVIEDYNYEDFYDKWKSSPIYLVMFKYTKMFIRFRDIKDKLEACKVADVYKQDEIADDIINDSRDLLQDLENDSEITDYQKEYRDLLERFLNLIDSISPNGSISDLNLSNSKAQDPNSLEFSSVLPEQIKSNAIVLRKWTDNWEQFDTTVPEGGAWFELECGVVNALSDPIELCDIIRESAKNDLPEFEFAIEGEAAWDVFKTDIVKNDETTKQQERIWKIRDNRTDLNDPTFLLSRQTRLEMYFINKYEWDSSKLDSYRGFTARLQKSWNEFQDLCGIEEYSVIPEDEF